MLFVYTILYFLSMAFYYIKLNVLSSLIMIGLAIFLYKCEFIRTRKIVTVRGFFALGFILPFGISLLKLSNNSLQYTFMTFAVVFVSYFTLYMGTYFAMKKVKEIPKNDNYKDSVIINKKIANEEILVITLMVITFISFAIEVLILGFIPAFVKDTPHAYSTFHVFALHYITTFNVYIPSIAICNYMNSEKNNRNRNFIIVSYVYVIILAVLMVSRAQLIISIMTSIFVILIFNYANIKNITKKYLRPERVIGLIFLFLLIYILITIFRSHDVNYLNNIFDMKIKLPVAISQPYIYFTSGFENLNYMINNIFRITFGRREFIPIMTLTFFKKMFPFVFDSPTYILKEELSTLTLIYDAYYDFMIIGVCALCFAIGYVGKNLENCAYDKVDAEDINNNNYIIIVLSMFCYYMLFSFFQTYFSLTDTWAHLIFMILLSLFFKMQKRK